MNILMLYPEFPDTFWGFKHALKTDTVDPDPASAPRAGRHHPGHLRLPFPEGLRVGLPTGVEINRFLSDGDFSGFSDGGKMPFPVQSALTGYI